MRLPPCILRASVPLTLFLPALASAEGTFTQAIGLFNAFVGIMLTVALITYGIGFTVWFVRLGTWPTYRTEGVVIMEWSVVIIFVLFVLLAIVQFFQFHPRAAAMVVSAIVALIIVWIILYLAAHSAPKKKKEAGGGVIPSD